MDLNAVKMFVHVVRQGSLTGAATKLKMPLPTLSRRIRQLEKQLDVDLLERSVHGTKLTDAGSRLYEIASRGIELLAESEQIVANDQAELRGRLRLSMPPMFTPWWEILSDFRALYPGVQIHVHTTERRVDLIEDGIDVALRVGDIATEKLVARHMLPYRHLLVASPSLIKSMGMPETPSDLNSFPCATWARGVDLVGTWTLGTCTIKPEAELSTNDYGYLRHMAISGMAVTELPPFLAATAIQEGVLVPVLPDYPLPEKKITLLYPSHKHPSTLVRAYLDFCRTKLSWIADKCNGEISEQTTRTIRK